jgi:hypothetical protein
MNIIRTKVVELNTLPAIAYKIKLASGGSGIKLHRTDVEETAFAVIDKRTGDAIPDGRVKADLFPSEAFDEAVEELAGLPYSARGKVRIAVSEAREDDEVVETTPEECTQAEIQMLYSDEFNAIVDRFTDEHGKMNYALMNKQFMQFAQSSKVVADLCGKKAKQDDILVFIVQNRAAFLANKRENISEAQAKALIDAIEDIDPRGAFKELKLYIRKKLAR